MATASVEGAEGHGHSHTHICVQDAQGLWLGPLNTDAHHIITNAEDLQRNVGQVIGASQTALSCHTHTLRALQLLSRSTLTVRNKWLLYNRDRRMPFVHSDVFIERVWSISCTIAAAQVSR